MTKTPNPIDIHVGARVRLRRMMLDISQEKLGEFAGITFQQIQRYEKGTNRISASRLVEFAVALSVPVAWFFADLPEAGGSVEDVPRLDAGDLSLVRRLSHLSPRTKHALSTFLGELDAA